MRQDLPVLIEAGNAESEVRVWVPMCSTGEGVYRTAIEVIEQFEAARRPANARIFATDTDEAALTIVRHGTYGESIGSVLTDERLVRHFDRPAPGRFRAHDDLRAAVLAATHDLLRAPPIFCFLDLIDCRNVPADLEPEILRRLGSRLHFALKDRGWLLFNDGRGSAALGDLFERISLDQPIYRKRLLGTSPAVAVVSESRQLTSRTASDQGSGSEWRFTGTGPINQLVRSKERLEEKLRSATQKIESMTSQLDTADSELQGSTKQLTSLYGELAILNEELQLRIRELNATNDDLTNLIGALEIAVVFLGRNLQIRRYTAAGAKLLGLTAADINLPLWHASSPFVDWSLAEQARRVIATSAPAESEFRSSEGHWYLRRVLPYLAAGQPMGAVVIWLDITIMKALQEEVTNIAALEQQRIGQELHDGIQQELTGLGLLAESLGEQLSSKDRTAEAALAARIAAGIAQTNLHVRSLAHGLVPIPIDSANLASALRELARSTREMFGIACDFESVGAVSRSDSATATHLYRIAQEAVRNATRHAQADRISLQLVADDRQLSLEIRDNGIGIPPSTAVRRGVGLRLMAHRCALLGGKFVAETQPRGGTRVACVLPTAGGGGSR